MRHRYALLRFLLLSFILAPAASAQMSVDPLEFDYEYPRLGGELGLANIWQSGMYRSGCGEFVEGARLNPSVALAFDYPIVQKMIRLEALLGFHWRSLTSVYNSRESVVLRAGTQSVPVDVDFENGGTASLSYVSVMPAIKFYPVQVFYVGGGIAAGFLTSSKTQYTKTILTRTVMIPNVGLSEVSYAEKESSDPYTMIFPEEELEGAASFALDAAAFAGAEFRISRNLKIGPRLMYSLPLTTVVDNPELKLQGFQFLVGVRYDLFVH